MKIKYLISLEIQLLTYIFFDLLVDALYEVNLLHDLDLPLPLKLPGIMVNLLDVLVDHLRVPLIVSLHVLFVALQGLGQYRSLYRVAILDNSPILLRFEI